MYPRREKKFNIGSTSLSSTFTTGHRRENVLNKVQSDTCLPGLGIRMMMAGFQIDYYYNC